ncbi:hypothetical protein [Microbacterium sp. PI-1]|uniref:hypothetical protein n=1 Tax=Microbacterium sp. PI-1 TaxID=2545631 RepID=UPI00140465CE|nr:hypothetical protein [Microbacterium sp. PI-1]
MSDPKLGPETEAAIERALDSAQLRGGDATSTASVIHHEPGESAVDDGAAGDGD